jgi:hypothetical protein
VSSKLALVWSAARGATDAAPTREEDELLSRAIVDFHARELDRFELKYWVPTEICGEVVEYARPYLVVDPFNVRDGLLQQYNTTLYLETARLDAYQTHVDGAADRYKLRVRAYGEVPGNLAFFETKRKINAITVKTRSAVAMVDAAALLEGTYDALPASLPWDERRHLETFLYLQTVTDARPCVLVRAHRESYCTADPREDVRLTFDREICFQRARGWSLHGDPKGWIPIDGYDQHGQHGAHTMIELKFPRVAPAWMNHLVNRLDMWRVGYSKYVAAVRTLLDQPMVDAMAWDLAGETD